MSFTLPKHKYIRTVRRPYPPFYASMFLVGAGTRAYHTALLKRPAVIRDIILCDSIFYYTAAELHTSGFSTLKGWNTARALKRAQKIFIGREHTLMRAARQDLKAYCAAYEQYMPALFLIFTIDPFVATAVRNALEEKLSAHEVQEMMDVLNIPLRDNFYKQEEYDLIHAQDIGAHVRKYAWLHSRYGEVRPYTLAEARKKRAAIDKGSYVRSRILEKQKVRAAIRKAKQMLGRDAYLVDLMQFIIYYRTQRTDVINKSSYVFAPTLAQIAKTRGISYQQALHCTKDEMLGSIPTKEILNARMKAHATIIDHGRVSVLIGRDYERLKAFVDKDVASSRQFSGVIASRGHVIGTVKVILGVNDFGKIKKGDILVASMTTPQMVAIMKKAAAFVTDEGGITCHAAIISRELKKPCIIGTKIATRVLKDGDQVEVDAEKGIVRKL